MAETTRIELSWHEGMRFVARTGSGHGVLLDSPGRPHHLAAAPMELMLVGIAGCTAMDVVAILDKMRIPLASLSLEVSGEREESNPKRFTAITMVYKISGHGLSRERVARAVELSHSTYCSAVASLRPDCRIETRIEIEES